ncbi:hypothetical protein C1J03_08185 [Sulfitobacter sp. SK012]|uniref:hypothetical protein n=1 Tax=Sulfitobacter sp. SK012 TaxID=1389005 RepID=UPI000E0C02F8|nr:hypothetical protein [Sulfitobacter sp. SK012]AXI45998.1 hypothetical protein C1J03_08185 [Sulfitobacter sp. SK012]
MGLRGLVLAVTLVLSGPATAGQKVYEGEEASALRCANMLALTGVTLRNAELMDDAEQEVLLGVTILILERHVSGTWAQKKAAMEQMRDRRSIEDTLADYQRNAPLCLGRFPIN